MDRAQHRGDGRAQPAQLDQGLGPAHEGAQWSGSVHDRHDQGEVATARDEVEMRDHAFHPLSRAPTLAA